MMSSVSIRALDYTAVFSSYYYLVIAYTFLCQCYSLMFYCARASYHKIKVSTHRLKSHSLLHIHVQCHTTHYPLPISRVIQYSAAKQLRQVCMIIANCDA